MRLIIIIFCLSVICVGHCQNSQGLTSNFPAVNVNVSAFSSSSLDKLSQFYTAAQASIDERSRQLLAQMETKELQLKSKVQLKDSTLAQQLFMRSGSIYSQLQSRVQSTLVNPINSYKYYLPGIDSMRTAIQFLSKAGLPVNKIQQLQAISQQLSQFQASWQNAGNIQDYVVSREAQLSGFMNNLGLGNRLSAMNKQIFYYQQLLSQYKGIINDQQKQQQLIMSVVRQVPAFQNFWQRNSTFSKLFPTTAPANSGTLVAAAGLQTRVKVGMMVERRLGTAVNDSGVNGNKYLEQQVGASQGKRDQLKQQLDQLRLPAGSSDMALPDFTPNAQAGKTFLKRLEYGFNIQNTGSTAFTPTTSTIGLSLGYRLCDKATAGVGLSYLIGFSKGLNPSGINSQGIGLRSFLDIKAKGSIWITGGFEYNYMQQFSSLHDLRDAEVWQKSALFGLTKKYQAGSHTGTVQLLYDLLAHYEIPQGQPLVLRFGYSL
jgi:hypothetical protein